MNKPSDLGGGLTNFQSLSNLNSRGWIIVIFALHFLPFLFNGSNAYIRIHDNLEGEWVWLDLLVKQGKALDFSPHAMIDNMLNGQLRAVFPAGFSVNVLLIYLFGSYWGYLISYGILHLLAFGGMYLLLRNHFLPEEKHRFIAAGVALCFSLVPFYVQFGAAGQPLLLYCFLNILKDRERWTDFLYIIFFPFWSSLVWTGFSAIAALGMLLLADVIRRKNISRKFLLALALLAVAYCLVNFQMLSLWLLHPGFISHRTEYNIFALQEVDFAKGLMDTIYPLLLGHYHAGTIVTLPILASAALAFYHGGRDKTSHWLLMSILAICFIYGFYVYVACLLGDVFPFLITFNANRFIILLPLLFLLLFAFSLKKMFENGIPGKAVGIIICCQLALGFFSNDEWLHNMRNLSGFKVKPGYQEYFAENLFREIDAFISQPKPSYRVASIGISPSVAQHNGFYTLDGLLPIYSLEHKRQFREIIAPEIEKNPELKDYFDGWGNRCYVFSSELGIADRNFLIGKNQQVALQDFDMNTEAFKKAGGRYIFSAVEISQPETTGLKLLGIFNDTHAWWRVYLYATH